MKFYPIINSKTAVSRWKQDSDFQITCLNITLNNICWFISVINVYVMAAIIITILIYRRFDTPTSKGWMVKSSLRPYLPRQYYECRGGGVARSRRKHCFHYYYLSHFHPCANCRGTLHTGTLAYYTFSPSNWAEGVNNVFNPLRIQDEFNAIYIPVLLSFYDTSTCLGRIRLSEFMPPYFCTHLLNIYRNLLLSALFVCLQLPANVMHWNGWRCAVEYGQTMR